MTTAERAAPRQAIRVVVLYPELMDVYADRGNLLAVQRRAAQLGIGVEVTPHNVGEPLPPDADLVLIGGGQDREQRYVEADLAEERELLRGWIDDGVAALAVCGGFQLFGHSYRTADGDVLRGVGIFDVETAAPPPGAKRCIGDVLAYSESTGIGEVVGFENHSGRTRLGTSAVPFARVRNGWGNNGEDDTEGVVHREAVGTYLHGPLLPKNPKLLDRLIDAALRHRYGPDASLPTPGDEWAERAHAGAVAVARKRGRTTFRRHQRAAVPGR